jgi:hypothetical protein
MLTRYLNRWPVRYLVFLAIGILALAVAGCTAAPKPADWLRERPFLPAPDWTPPMITENLPLGFTLGGPESSIETAPDGSGMRVVRVFYLLPAGGQVSLENNVAAFVAGFSTQERRNAFLDSMIADTMTAEFDQAGGQQIVRFHDSSSDLRMWVSGPFLIAVQSRLDPASGGRNAWVDTFAERYILLYPAGAEGMVPALSPTPAPFDWLIAFPFVPTPDWTPPVITTGLPGGFQAATDTSAWELPRDFPGGHSMRAVAVEYTRPAAGATSKPDEVDVGIFGFSDLVARTLEVYSLGKGEEPNLEPEWGYAQLGGERVARLTSPYAHAYAWVAGPYLVLIFSRPFTNAGGQNPWVEPFAEMYLSLYPPRADLAFPSPTPNPSAWLNGALFQPVPEGTPAVVTDDLPEGYSLSAVQPINDTSLDGYTARGALVEYRFPVATTDGALLKIVIVMIVGYSDKKGRDEQLRWISGVGPACQFAFVGGQKIVECYESNNDVRLWNSGSYLVIVGNGNPQMTVRNPSLDQFAEKYLALYPSQ